eukprot:3016996-Pyramimonas_sp.AAC.1
MEPAGSVGIVPYGFVEAKGCGYQSAVSSRQPADSSKQRGTKQYRAASDTSKPLVAALGAAMRAASSEKRNHQQREQKAANSK